MGIFSLGFTEIFESYIREEKRTRSGVDNLYRLTWNQFNSIRFAGLLVYSKVSKKLDFIQSAGSSRICSMKQIAIGKWKAIGLDTSKFFSFLFCSVLFTCPNRSPFLSLAIVLNSIYSTVHCVTRYPVLCTSMSNGLRFALFQLFPHCSVEFRSGACGAPLCSVVPYRNYRSRYRTARVPRHSLPIFIDRYLQRSVCPLTLNHLASSRH